MGSFSFELENGGGITHELVAWPCADDWVWRMSVAQVAQSGPFSRFDGIDRWFAVLKGDGVALLTRGQRHALTSSSAPCYFDGALPVACELLAGSTLDFNLMTRQGSASTNRTVHAGPMASSTFGLCCADWVL